MMLAEVKKPDNASYIVSGGIEYFPAKGIVKNPLLGITPPTLVVGIPVYPVITVTVPAGIVVEPEGIVVPTGIGLPPDIIAVLLAISV